MKHLSILFLTIIFKTNISAQSVDTISFIKSKKMLDADLTKKREGALLQVFQIYHQTL